MTLAIVHQSPKILLGLKKMGFGEGRWNGFGGKLKEDETVEEAAIRELEEEAGITAKAFDKLGEMTFEFKDDPTLLVVHLFKVHDFEGEPIESDEMRPIWFSESDIPFDSMWPDDKLWFPYFLAGRKFKGHFLLDDISTLTDYEINEVENFDDETETTEV